MEQEQLVNEIFAEKLGELSDEQFWDFIREYFDEQYILDIMNEWETETKIEAIEEMNKILKENKTYKSKKNGIN